MRANKDVGHELNWTFPLKCCFITVEAVALAGEDCLP